MIVLDRLEMLVTCDPVAELDAALSDATRRRRDARAAGDVVAVAVLTEWIDHRLDERREFED